MSDPPATRSIPSMGSPASVPAPAADESRNTPFSAHEGSREALTHSVLMEVQRRLALEVLSDEELFDMCAQAALTAIGGAGARIELCVAAGLRTVACAGQETRPRGSLELAEESPEWCTLLQLQAVQIPGPPALLRVPLCRPDGLAGVINIWSESPDRFDSADLEHLKIMSDLVVAQLRMREVAAQLRASQQQYQCLFDAQPAPMYVFAQDASLRLLAVNDAVTQEYGYSRQELLQMSLRDLWPPDKRDEHQHSIQQRFGTGSYRDVIREHQRRDGSLITVEISSREFLFDGQPARQSMAVDITLRRASEREIARMARALRLLGACNEAIVRGTSEEDLLKAVCQITIEIGGYRMAWVGMAELDAAKTIRCAAYAGANDGYLESLTLSWDDVSPDGRGPSGVTVRTGRTVVVPDVCQEPEYAHLAQRLTARGFYGMLCLPLRENDCTFGVLYLYAPEVINLSVHEVELLEKLAQDVSFGLLSLRARREQQRMQAAVLKVAATVSASTGQEFFVQLAQNMAEAVGAHSACIGRFLPGAGQTPETLRTLALVVNKQLMPGGEYALQGTPSSHLATQYQLCVESGLHTRYPRSVAGRTDVFEAYVGQQLCASSGAAIGVIFVLFRERLHNSAFVQSTLQIFASRVSAEIERQTADAHIRWQASVLDQARDAIVVLDMKQQVTYWNKGAERLYGHTHEQALGQNVKSLLCLDPAAFQHAAEEVTTHGEWSGEMTKQHRDGTVIDTEGRWTLVRSDSGESDSVLAISTDIRERKSTEREIQRLAFYDALTGLPNRMLLMDRAHHALAQATRSGAGGAMLFIDLDNFKTLNDTLGHDKGDLLLQQVAQRLQTCVRGSDTVARLGGDEFVVMLGAQSGGAPERAMEARAVAEKILTILAMPYQLGNHHYRTTPSIGIAPFTGGEQTVGDLLKQADLAMYQAKTGGRNTLRFFDPQMQAVVSERAALEDDMRAALAQGDFLLHYQPQVRHNGDLLGVEALARWKHREHGMIPPGKFIPVAEDTGLILTLGRWVLHTACQTLAQWQAEPRLRHLTMAVNVSSKQFRSSTFVQDVSRILAVTGAPADRLKLELTESVLVDNVEGVIATMEALRATGVGFSLDDFGTGYSSLSYLKRMPLQQLKIDQSFVHDLLSDPNDAAIVDTIVALSAALGLDVIAEGVETLEQRQVLLEAGCMTFQGYFYSRPLSALALQELLAAQEPCAST